MSDELSGSFPTSGSASVDDPSSQTPVESSGLSCQSSPLVRPPPKPQQPQQKKPVYHCHWRGCKKTYKQKGRFDSHLVAHNLSDANARMPSLDDFIVIIDGMVKDVLEKMLPEPIVGANSNLQINFIQKVLEEKLEDLQWLSFVSSVASPILMALEEPSKLFPQNRYEEALVKLNTYLNLEENRDSLARELAAVTVYDIDLPFNVACRLIFRMAQLLLDQVWCYVAREMRSVSDEDGTESVQTPPMSEKEKVQFVGELGRLLRAFFHKGLKEERTSKMWRSLCKCLKQRFVSSSTSVVTSQDFLDKPLWYAKDDSSIIISDKVVDFFLFVEELVKKKSDVNTFRPLEDVMSDIYANVNFMGYWYTVTNGFFSDENAVYVMKLMVRNFRDRSIQLEQELIMRGHQISKVALRTGLKRN